MVSDDAERAGGLTTYIGRISRISCQVPFGPSHTSFDTPAPQSYLGLWQVWCIVGVSPAMKHPEEVIRSRVCVYAHCHSPQTQCGDDRGLSQR
jgi:hypothetical protein